MRRLPLCAAIAGLLTAGAPAPGAAPQAIEKRATCIIHEGGDVPPSGSPMPRAGCAGKELDGTVCDDLDEAEAGRCRAREIAVWDGVLDRLVRSVAGSHRAAPTRGAVSAFRTFRDRACAAYRTVAVNPSSVATVASCRLSETVRFAQKLYDAVHSP